jgi:hypothetical protein
MDSTPYYVVTGFFLPTIAFFAVGMRIELFLINSCVLPDLKISWKPSPYGAFWIEAVVLIFCVVEALIGATIVYANTKGRKYVLVWLLDFILAGVCLIILMISEAQRCCNCDRRDLALSSPNISDSTTCGVPSNLLCCPSFGKRQCGGLGHLEPFTALIGLRAFSWLVLRPILNRSRSTSNAENSKCSNTISYDRNIPDFSHLEGNMIDLWKRAVIKFPDIVERHGKFSAELLQAMLDIPPEFKDDVQPTGYSHQTKEKGKELFPTTMQLVPFDDNGTPLVEKDKSQDTAKESWSPITEPDAMLIRAIRRCEQKLLPFMDDWVIADILLTENELIWFEVASTDSVVASELMQARSFGGYGMRVSDLCQGRIVAGRFALNDIRAIHIEHHSPIQKESRMMDNQIQETSALDENFQKELWEEEFLHEKCLLPIKERWDRVAYDSLSIQSSEGTLLLRFLVDLRDGEVPMSKTLLSQDRDSSGPIPMVTNEASVWCDVIAKKIGKSPTQSTSGGVVSQFRKTLSMAVAARSFRNI